MYEKLSKLIREGGKKYPQGYGQFVKVNAEGKVCGACALGGAALEAGIDVPTLVANGYSPLRHLCEATDVDLYQALPGHDSPLWRVIAHKNDTGSTTEDIANWLDAFTTKPVTANPRDMDRLWED